LFLKHYTLKSVVCGRLYCEEPLRFDHRRRGIPGNAKQPWLTRQGRIRAKTEHQVAGQAQCAVWNKRVAWRRLFTTVARRVMHKLSAGLVLRLYPFSVEYMFEKRFGEEYANGQA